MAASVTQAEFADIVRDEVDRAARAVGVTVGAYSCTVTFRSASGKSRWDSHMDFDPDRNWHYGYTCPYLGGTPWTVGDAIQRRLRALS